MPLLPPIGIGEFRVTQTTYTLGVAPIQIASLSPNRIAIIFSTTGNGAVIGINSNLAANTGLAFGATTVPFALDWHTYGAVVNQAWYGLFAAGAPMTVIEVFYDPKPNSVEADNGNATSSVNTSISAYGKGSGI